ncbi:response regulator [Streptomyces sp. NBC_00554]|uniref:response regulator transcription factor n=1 Tax=unclassified Streptomyces TaxID=2593676 RepID=UPI00352C61F3|nr:response regulator transcription factor [Streptomyces sp. NBC_00564]WUC53441.1 response regulator transcription factor [Streptomyces sp. NBC_00554]
MESDEHAEPPRERGLQPVPPGGGEGALRVVLADDHPVVRTGLAALLESVRDGTPGVSVVGVASGGREAVRAAVTLRPHVVVMDIRMPDMNGIEATREIGRVAPAVAVLMLTMVEEDDSVFAAMRAGARGYVLKGAGQDEIVRAIRAVAAGEAIFGPGVARRVLGQLSRPLPQPDPCPALTPRERDVLTLIAAGTPNATVAARLGLSPKTVSNHMSAVLAKLGVADRAEAAAWAREAGLGPAVDT